MTSRKKKYNSNEKKWESIMDVKSITDVKNNI